MVKKNKRIEMKKLIHIMLFFSFLLLIFGIAAACGQEVDPGRFEAAIMQFEEMDKVHFPEKGVIVFTGSSSIKLWKTLSEDFIPFNVIKRGFGGSHISDVIHFADRIIIPYKPSMVLLYAGDNDVASGKKAERVFNDFKTLVKHIHKSFPGTSVFYIPIKPSIQRWAMWGEMNRANNFIKKYAKNNDLIEFIDIGKPMIGKDGKPRAELFLEDGLHLNAEGYKLWASIVRPFILKYVRE